MAQLTSKREIENYLHPDAIAAVWPDVSIAVEDVSNVPHDVAQAVHANSDSQHAWPDLLQDRIDKKVSSGKRRLCSEGASAMTPGLLAARDPDDEVIGWLQQIEGMINSV